MNITEYSVKHPVSTTMIFFAVVLIGIFCTLQFPIDQLPEVDIPTLTVITIYEGASPEDVEEKVTKILEDQLATIPDLKHIVSVSSEGMSKIILSFEWQTDLDTRANDARDAIDKAKMFLPDDIEPPRVLKFNMAEFPVMILGVKAKESYKKLEKILEDYVTDDLKRIPGVAMATAVVPLRRQVNVYADKQRLVAYGLNISDIVHAIAKENVDIPAGYIKQDEKDYLVRLPGQFKSVDEIGEIIIGVRNNGAIRLKDVASVEDEFREITEYVRVDGSPGAAIVIRKQSGANTVKVVDSVRKRLKVIEKRLPRDIKIIPVMDSSQDIKNMVKNLVQTLYLGILLTGIVVFIFLRNFRGTIIIALEIPFSLLLALTCIYFLGYTINLMTLFGLVVSVGVIVDNSIVILENIMKHKEEGERIEEAAIYGTTEVGLAVAASTLTTVCIFFPILFIKGITKIFFSQFAVVASITIIGSLISALTLTPMLSSVLMKKDIKRHITGKIIALTDRWFESIEYLYSCALKWALNHRGIVVCSASILLILSILLARQLGGEFMPKEDRNIIRGVIYMPVGTKVEVTQHVMERIAEIINEEVYPEERIAVFTRCGTSGRMGAVMFEEAPHIGSFTVRLATKDKRDRSDKEIANIIRRRLKAVKNELNIDKFIISTEDILAMMILGGERTFTVNILGNDIELTDNLAFKIRKIMERVPGIVDIDVSREKARAELHVCVDRVKASWLGFNVSMIGNEVRTAFYGSEAGKYRVGGDEYDIFVRVTDLDRDNISDVASLSLRKASGEMVRLDNIADLKYTFGPVKIERKDQTRVVNVTADVIGRSLKDVTVDVENAIKKLDIPPEVSINIAGQVEEMRESFTWLTLALVIGIILVYMVMASQFESLLAPFVIMFSVPFAFTGVFMGLWIRGYHISTVVYLGMLLLIGTVVNNAIVLVDYIGILQKRGFSIADAITEAGRRRLRPVLMTTITTVIALVPMAFKGGQGSEIWNPLGTTILSGLIVSTLVTLILVPTVYNMVNSLNLKLKTLTSGR